MKSFARGTRKKPNGKSRLKKIESDDDRLVDIFGRSPTGEESMVPSEVGSLVTGDLFQVNALQRSGSLGADTFGAYSSSSSPRLETFGRQRAGSGETSRFGVRQEKAAAALGSDRVSASSSGSTALGGTARRTTRTAGKVGLVGSTRPNLGNLGIGFEPESISGEFDHSVSEVEEWKSKYFALKEEYDSLLKDYDELLLSQRAQSAKPNEVAAEKDIQISKLTDEIKQLKLQLTHKAKTPTGPYDSQQQNDEKKILQQNEEIQKLLEQRITMEAELSDMKYKMSQSGGGDTAGTGNFDADRQINNLKAIIKEKDDEIEQIDSELTMAKNELARLGNVMELVADQVEKNEKKGKKKTWWGGTKKKRIDPTKLTAAELDAFAKDATSMAGAHLTESPKSDDSHDAESHVSGSRKTSTVKTSPHPGGLLLRSSHPGGVGSPSDCTNVAVSVVNRRLVELERENARLEGEIEILEKEKKVLNEKLNRVEAQVEILQVSKKNEDANLNAIAVARSITVPLPRDGGSETDRLQVVIQLQEAALQKISLKSSQLEDTLKMYSNQQGDIEDRMYNKEMRLRENLTKTGIELSQLKQNKRKLEEDIKLKNMQISALEDEVERLKEALSIFQMNSKAGAKQLKQRADSYASMMTTLLRNNEELQGSLSQSQTMHMEDCKLYQGEVRALREGRVKRLDGDPPNSRVFPNSPPLPKKSEEASRQTERNRSDGSSKNVQFDKNDILSNNNEEVVVMTAHDSKIGSHYQQPSHSSLRYVWTPDDGYQLTQELTIQQQQQQQQQQPHSNQLEIKPIVTVETRPGPSPIDMNPLTPLHQVINDYPEVDQRDKDFAQAALQEWLNKTTNDDNARQSLSLIQTPSLNHKMIPLPTIQRSSTPPPPQRRKRNTGHQRVVVFDPLSSESKGSSTETQKPTVVQSDWGPDMSVALLSFGKQLVS